MRLLPFLDIPVIEDSAPADRLSELVKWADGDKTKLSAAFLAFENEGENVEDYLFQIGFIKDDCLVTNKETIEHAAQICVEYKKWKEYMKILYEVRAHLELYFSKIGSVPPWGSVEYNRLRAEGYTPRILEGPHKVGKLKPNQKRKVIIGPSKELVFGPLLN